MHMHRIATDVLFYSIPPFPHSLPDQHKHRFSLPPPPCHFWITAATALPTTAQRREHPAHHQAFPAVRVLTRRGEHASRCVCASEAGFACISGGVAGVSGRVLPRNHCMWRARVMLILACKRAGWVVDLGCIELTLFVCELQSDPTIRTHLAALYDMLFESNLKKIIELYLVIEVAYVAEHVWQER
ncbi:hypothetical protein CVT25_012786 [Psilocybe cyanescens]|uniref:Uncharacterized protein n=1 Tax=Psilocybe cyanescens TaxID=93625 RepID=A0A409XLI6_PSICY|nr:hypothetical protein CVT25_012786 [Psilocybe cyanescens]